jgi:hypothetical protein
MGFTRRFGYYPPRETIRQIEGVSIVDLSPPGAITGVNTGVVAMVGEFVDSALAVLVSSTGVVTGGAALTVQPQELTSPASLLALFGGFDATIGQFGTALGNGFVALRNKRFSRLVVAPVDIVTPTSGSTYGMRVWRELPTNKSATDPTPIVPVSGGQVVAGREFITGTSLRCKTAQRVVFSDAAAYATGTNGDVVAAPAAATQTFDRAAGSFIVDGAQVGDALVVGALGGAGTHLANAGTYRIVSITDLNTIVVEKLDGSNFAWTTGASQVWRLHAATTIDSGAVLGGAHAALATNTGYLLPGRPNTANILATLALTPTTVPTAATATSWDTLSGLTGKMHPDGPMVYDALVHGTSGGGNYPSNNALLNARYTATLEALLNDEYPAREVNIVVAARKSSTIRSALRAHVLTASERGLTRTECSAPELSTQTLAAVVADADPGVGANRGDRVDYSWPGCMMFVPEAVGSTVATADSKTTTDGMLDDSFDVWLASILSNLAPERNPGQAAPPVPSILAGVLGFQRGAPKLNMADYILLRSKGIAALRFDRVSGAQVQSGITTSLTSGEENIARRRMADFIQDSIAARLGQLAKLPLSQALQDTMVSECEAFLADLRSENNPAASRINDYVVDPKSGNTPANEALGIFVIITKVRLTPTMDFVVLQTEIGEGVVITRTAEVVSDTG